MLETTAAARCSWELPLCVGWLCKPGVLCPVPPSNESVLAHLVAMMAMLRCLFQWDWPWGGLQAAPKQAGFLQRSQWGWAVVQ